MKNPRKTILYLFLAFHILLFFGAWYVDRRQDDLGFLLSMKGYISWITYYALLGLVLFLAAYIAVMRDTRHLRKAVKKANDEHLELKAKLFDLQEQLAAGGFSSANQSIQQPAQDNPSKSSEASIDTEREDESEETDNSK